MIGNGGLAAPPSPRFATITDPVALECAINQIVGVVTVGLFAARGADVLIVASDKGVDTL